MESTKSTIFKSIAIGATVVGGAASVILGGPLGLGLFAAFAEAGPVMLGGLAAGGAAGGVLGGLGIGAGTKKWFPRKWFGEQTALRKAMKRLKQSLKGEFGGEVESSENATLPIDSSAPVNTTAIPNNEAPDLPSSTSTLSDHAESTQNNSASISSNKVTNTILSNSTAEAGELTIPTNRAEVIEFDSTNLLQVAVNTVRNLFSNFLPRLY